jgi:hypothetical protein
VLRDIHSDQFDEPFQLSTAAWSRELAPSGGGTGVVSHAGLALLRRLADVTKLTAGLPTAAGRRLIVTRIRTWSYSGANPYLRAQATRPRRQRSARSSAYLWMPTRAGIRSTPRHRRASYES